MGVLLALGLNSIRKLDHVFAVRLGPNDWLTQHGGFRPPLPDLAARLEADRVNWVRCGRGWMVREAPVKVGALSDADLVGLVREAFRDGHCRKRSSVDGE